MDIQSFHRHTANELRNLYTNNEHAPEGWREVLLWHLEQASAYGEAVNIALEAAELCIGSFTFPEARRWIDRTLTILDSQRATLGNQHTPLSLRTYALIIAILEFNGQYREALGYAQLFIHLAEEQDNLELWGRGHLTLGRVMRELGQFSTAEHEIFYALNLAERHHLSELLAEARFHLAKVHQLQGRHLEAFQQLELAHHGSLDNHARLARIWTGIGDGYRVLGACNEAMRLYQRALRLEVENHNRLGQAILQEKLGLSYLALGQKEDALHHAYQALHLRQEMKDTLGQARSHTALGTIYSQTGEYQQAFHHFQEARTMEMLLQNHRGLTMALTNLGDTARSLKDFTQARASYAEALILARDVDDQIALARLHERLGDLSYQEGSKEIALTHWGQALSIRQQLGHSEEANALRDRIRPDLLRP